MPSPLNISLKVTGLDQAKADLQQFAQGGKRSFEELAAQAQKLSETSATTDKSLSGVANRVRQMAADMDPAGAASIRLRNALTDVDRALKAEIISAGQASQITATLRHEHELLGQATAATAARIQQLTAKFDPATASAKQMAAELAELHEAARLGINIAGGYTAAFDRIVKKYDEGAQAARRFAEAQAVLIAQARAEHNASSAQHRFNQVLGVNPGSGQGSAAASASVFEESIKEQERLAAAAQKYKDQLNPLLPLQRAYRAELASVNQVAAAGLLSDQQRAAAIRQTKDAFAEQVISLKAAAAATQGHATAAAGATTNTRSLNHAVANLGYQVNDIATGLVMGQSPFMILAQQGGQVTQIFSENGGAAGVLKAFGARLAGLLTPTTAAVAGVAALAGGFGLLIARAGSTEERLRSFDVILTGMGTRSNATAAGLDAVVRSLRETGTAADEALKAVQAFARTPGINPASAATLVPLARDIGAATGEDLTSVSKKIAGAFSESTEAAIKLVQSLTGPNGLTVAQIANMRAMSAHGDRAGALKVAIGALKDQFGGGFENSLSAGAKAINSIGTAWDNMLTALSKTSVVQGARDAVIGMLNGIAGAVTTPLAAPVDWRAERNAMIPGGRGYGFTPNYGVGGALTGGDAALMQLGATPAEIAILRQIRQRESRGVYNTFHATGDVVSSLDDVRAFPGQSHAFGGYGFQPGTFLDMAARTGRSDISPFSQDANALQLLRMYGPNATASWAASMPPGGYPTAGISYGSGVFGNLGRGTSAAVENGVSQKSLADLQQRQDLLDRYNFALRKTGEELIATRAYEEAWASSIKEGLERHWEAQTAAADAVAKHSIEIGKQADTQRLTNDLAMQTARAYGTDVVAGLQAAARAQAELDVRQGTASNAQARYNELLQTGAAEAVKSAAMALPGLRQQTEASERLAEAVTKGAAAEHDAEIQAKTAAATQDMLTKARAAGIDVTQGVVKSLSDETAALIRRNAVAQAATKFGQANIRDRSEIEVIQLQAGLQGQTTEEINRQVALLRTKQEWLAAGGQLNDAELANRLQVVDALGQANAKLAETTRYQQQIDGIFRSIGDTIASSIGNVIDGIFDKKKVIDWGQAAKGIFNQLAQSLVIRPLTGELLSAFGASPNVVSQYGTFGGGSGGGGLGLGTLLQGGGLLKDIFGLGGGGSGGGLFSGVSDFFGGGLGGIFAHTPMDFGGGGAALGVADVFGGSTVPGSIFGSTTFGGALGGFGLGMGAGGLINSLMGGNSMFGTIGSGLGSLVGMVGGPIGSLIGGALGGLFGGMFGNKKPRNQSAGGNIDFATGRVFDMFSGGNPQIDQATHAVIQQLGGFTQRLLQLSGGRLSGEVLLQNGVNTGFTADSSLPGYEGRFNLGRDPAEVVRVVSLALSRSLEDISGTMRHVINQVSDPAKLESALQFAATYERIDEAFRGAFAEIDPERVGPFAQAMAQINAIFADATAKAGEFGLSLDPLNAGLAEATRRLQGDFTEALDRVFNEASGAGFLNQIEDLVEALSQSRAEAEAIGLGGDTGTQSLIDRVFAEQLESILAGLDAAQLQQVSTSFTELDASIVALMQSAEAAAVATTQLAEAEQQAQAILAAGAQISDYVASLSATAPGLSPEAALAGAQSLYADTLAAAQAGDVDAYQDLVSVSQQLIDATEAYYASGAETAAAVAQVSSDLMALPGVAEDADINELTLQLIDAQRETTDAILTLDLTTQAVSASLLNLIALNDQIAAAAAASNEALAAELIGGVEAASAAMILQLDADAAEIVAAMEGGTALILAESAAQTEALIASNAATVADITARNAEESAALIAGNEAVTAAITALNDMLAQTLFDANADAAEGIISENTAATGELIAANDSATAAIVAQYSASANELLAGASQDAQAVAASVYDIGDEISLVMTSATNNLMLATTNGANSVIEAGAAFSNSEIAAITATATNSVTAAGEFSSNEISAVTNGANSIVEAAGAFSSNEIAALGSGIASLLAAGLEYANGIVAALGSGASSVIAAGSSYTSSLITAITDTTSNLINSEGVYANNQLVAVYETTAAVRETTTAVRDATGWMQQIRDVTAAYGDVANDQRNTMIGLLQQIASTVGMLSSGGGTYYDPGPGSDGGGSDSGY